MCVALTFIIDLIPGNEIPQGGHNPIFFVRPQFWISRGVTDIKHGTSHLPSSVINVFLTHWPFCSPRLTWLSSPHMLLLFVPQGDRGGHLTLQKRWTSFLKTRLTCSLPEYDFHFNMLRSIFVMHGLTPQDTLFYGIFGLEWWVEKKKFSVRVVEWDGWGIEIAEADEWDSIEKQQPIHWSLRRSQEGMS